MKTPNSRNFLFQLHGTLTAAWQKCVLAGARELDEMRARSGPACPHCGGHLIQRRVMFGRDAGKQFWDCSNVPRCSVTLAAEEVSFPGATITAAAA